MSTAVYLTLLLLIFTFPFARHWLLHEWPEPAVYYEYRSLIFYLSDAALLLYLFAFFIWQTKNPPPPRASSWGPPAITLPLILLTILAALSALTAQEPALAVMLAGRLCLLFLLYVALIRFHPNPKWTAVFLGLTVITQSTIGLLQFLYQQDLGWQQLGEIDIVAAPGGSSIITVGSQSWLRAYGLTPHPNILGGILVTALLMLFIFYLQANGRSKIVWLLALGLGTAALLVTFSRSAWLGGAAGGLVLVVALLMSANYRHLYGRQLLYLAIIGLIILGLFAFTQRELLLSRLQVQTGYTETRSINERMVLNDLSLEIIKQRPLLGIGASNFSLAVVPPISQMTGINPQPVHNIPLLTASELGIIGGLLWLWLMIAPLIITIRQHRQQPLSPWAWSLTAALTALAVIDLFDFYSWGWPQGRLWRWMLCGLWAAALYQESATTQPARSPYMGA